MSLPREGSRTIREGIIVAEPMDWCRSPSAIVPYKIYTHHQVEGAQNADSMRQTDERSHVKGSLIRQCYGDEPGVGGGVISGTRGAECTPKTWSSTVRFQDRNAVRHDDSWWMNHKNTWGRLVYTKYTKVYDTDEEKKIQPKMQRAALGYSTTLDQIAVEGSSAPDTRQAFEFPIVPRVVPRIAPELGPRMGPRLVPRVPPRLAPKPGPEPGPAPQPGPKPPGPGLRITGCRSDLICFELGKYNETEYRKQLKLQQDKLNSKSSCDNVKDIKHFDDQTPEEKRAQRRRANAYRDSVFLPDYLEQNPDASLVGKNALHSLDMVAGGYETDFADIGDSGVNQSIGGEWPAGSRKGKLKAYAAEMCKKGCRMSVTLDICEDAEEIDGEIA